MRERNTLDDYFMYKEPPNSYEILGRYPSSPPISSSLRIVPKTPNEIDDLRRKAKACDFKASALEKIELLKIIESQGPGVGQLNRVAASKLSDLKGNSPEEGKMRTDVLKEKMALEREIVELWKRKEEVANQIRILNEESEERLKEVARKEEIVDREIKEWMQKNVTAKITERSLREKGTVQEAESAALFRREEELHKREEQVLEREEKMVRV